MPEKTYSQRLKPSGNSYGQAFSAAKKAGKKEFTWKGRDYTTETADERKADFKRETRREQYKRKESTGEGGGLSDFEGAHKTAKKQFGPNYKYKHKGKEYLSDVKGDKPRREGYDTMVMANKGGRVGAKKGKLIGMRSEEGKRADEKLVAAKKLERLQDMAKSGSLTYHQKASEGRKELSKRRLHQTGGRVGRQLGGRANLLEEVGRLDAERMNPNRRAEKSRVIGELNRGYTHGGLIKGFPKLAKKGWS